VKFHRGRSVAAFTKSPHHDHKQRSQICGGAQGARTPRLLQEAGAGRAEKSGGLFGEGF